MSNNVALTSVKCMWDFLKCKSVAFFKCFSEKRITNINVLKTNAGWLFGPILMELLVIDTLLISLGKFFVDRLNR